MTSAESFSSKPVSPGCSPQQLAATDVELMPMDEVLHQNDVDVLKSQLAAAHQLLNYQQNVVHSLTEQIQIQETHLNHAERQVDELQQQCQTQTIDIAEMRTVCTDLRSQLKRQSRRQSQLNSLPASSLQPSSNLGFEIQGASRESATISFGYESARSITPVPEPLTKAPPVEAWSASHVQTVHEEVTFCQKLTTFIVSSTSRVSSCAAQITQNPLPQTIVTDRSEKPQPMPASRSTRSDTVELPSFAMGN